jgi:N-acetylglucosaminyldiphosphoundecaprenol N-acetyl-beta-D-mannosaminyltransferase
MRKLAQRTTPRILGVRVDPLDMESAVSTVARQLEAGLPGYVSLIGVHGIVEAQRDPALSKLYAGATLVVPDGMPTVWIGRWQGFKHMERVAGPDLMLEVLSRPEFCHCRHFLYGGQPGIAEELKASLVRRFPSVKIVGTYTPPFRALTFAEEKQLADEIHRIGVDVIWVGISTPKQERFMARMLPLLQKGLMFGVGAAFDFHTGRIKDSPRWVKRAGLQWMHRMLQDPRRLFWRYLRSNSLFLWHMSLELTGIRSYPPAVFDDTLPGASSSGCEPVAGR